MLHIKDKQGIVHSFIGLTYKFLLIVPRILKFRSDDAIWCKTCMVFIRYRDLVWESVEEAPDPVTASMVNESAIPQTVHDAPTRQIGKAEEISIAVEAALGEKKDDEC